MCGVAGAQPGGGPGIQVHQASAAAAPPATDAAKQHIINRLQLHLDHSQPSAAVAQGATAAVPWRLNAGPSGGLHQLCKQHRQLAADAAAQVSPCTDWSWRLTEAFDECAAMLCRAGRTGPCPRHVMDLAVADMTARLGRLLAPGRLACVLRSPRSGRKPELHGPARYPERTCMSRPQQSVPVPTDPESQCCSTPWHVLAELGTPATACLADVQPPAPALCSWFSRRFRHKS